MTLSHHYSDLTTPLPLQNTKRLCLPPDLRSFNKVPWWRRGALLMRFWLSWEISLVTTAQWHWPSSWPLYLFRAKGCLVRGWLWRSFHKMSWYIVCFRDVFTHQMLLISSAFPMVTTDVNQCTRVSFIGNPRKWYIVTAITHLLHRNLLVLLLPCT